MFFLCFSALHQGVVTSLLTGFGLELLLKKVAVNTILSCICLEKIYQ